MHTLIESVKMFGKRVITGWRICYKNKGWVPTERVKWLNACSSWYDKVTILIDFPPFCWTHKEHKKEPVESRLLSTPKSSPNIFSKLLTLAKHTWSEICQAVLGTEWLYEVIISKLGNNCLCGLSNNSVLFAAGLDYVQNRHNITKVCTDASRYDICFWCSKY